MTKSFRSRLCILVAVSLLFSQSSRAQNNAEAAAAAVVGVAAIAAAAIEAHQMLEMLETQALNYVIANHPEMESFRLKVLDLEGKKSSDIGAMSVMTFRITKLNKLTGEEIDRSVLMMFTSNGWMNPNGIDFRFVSWKMFNRWEWNDMFAAFVALNSPIEIDRNTFSFPRSERLKKKNYNPDDSLHYCIKDDCYALLPNFKLNLLNAEFGKKGMQTLSASQYGETYIETTLPFYILQNDDYIVGDYSDEFSLFANEKSMGLFLKNTNESLQLQRSLVSTIHAFINKRQRLDYW
jgi:hypothetical protein